MENQALRLGHLIKVDPRKIWATEDNHFTPWLAKEENLKLLGDTVGVELELEAQEKSVGSFRADILCKDTLTDNWVLIENQLERTDHRHLGQLITYAPGLKAVTIIWIANPFTEEHRAAIDWLNEITGERFNFFGLEIELWQISDSPIAPKFNVICKPNDWSRNVAAGASIVKAENLSEAKLLQQRYWAAFSAFVNGRKSNIKPTKPLPQHWMNIAIGRSGFKLTAIASYWDSQTESYGINELRAELEINGTNSKEYFSQLQLKKDEIERELGYTLNWYNPPEKQVCRLFIRKTADLKKEGEWLSQHEWLFNRLNELHKVFYNRVKDLKNAQTQNFQ